VDRIAVALKAAEIISGPRRAQLCAATMIGTGKNMWQAEIDVGTEMPDFLRFGSKYAAAVHAQQPADHSAGVRNRLEYRGLEGFVAAISPFNFLAIGCNLVSALMIRIFSMLFVPFHHDHFRLWPLPLWATSSFGNRVIQPY
jgi:1-pyrroline-5-carboxylate dehydrogenase